MVSAATTTWYIVKIENDTCQIINQIELDAAEAEITTQWGPYADRADAIAKRVGLIRAGKCQPI